MQKLTAVNISTST
jgi:hypothetical protein